MTQQQPVCQGPFEINSNSITVLKQHSYVFAAFHMYLTLFISAIMAVNQLSTLRIFVVSGQLKGDHCNLRIGFSFLQELTLLYAGSNYDGDLTFIMLQAREADVKL